MIAESFYMYNDPLSDLSSRLLSFEYDFVVCLSHCEYLDIDENTILN